MTKKVRSKPLALKIIEHAIEQNRKIENRRPALLNAKQKIDQIGKMFSASYRPEWAQPIADEWHDHNLIGEALEIARMLVTGELSLVDGRDE